MADETWPGLDTGRTAEEWAAEIERVTRERDAAIARAEKAERERDEERFLATERGEMLTKLEAEMNDLRFKLAAIQKQRDEATARWSSAYSELHEARAAYQGTISTLKLRIEEVQKERDGARAQLATARVEGARQAAEHVGTWYPEAAEQIEAWIARLGKEPATPDSTRDAALGRAVRDALGADGARTIHYVTAHVMDARQRSIDEHGGSVGSAMVVASCDEAIARLTKLAEAVSAGAEAREEPADG